MSACLSHRFAQRIRDLLALRLSQEKIAARLGMSPANVGKIARQLADEAPQALDDLPPGFDQRNLRRCPGCGAMVYLWPCLTCTSDARETAAGGVRAASRAAVRKMRTS